MLFNRVIKNFVIQGGDVNRPGTTEDWTSRGKHYNQLDTRSASSQSQLTLEKPYVLISYACIA